MLTATKDWKLWRTMAAYFLKRHVEKAFIIKFSPYFDPAVVSLNKGSASYKEYISEILHNISLSF